MLGRISFVCQAGRLEAQAVLLAASLRAHFPADLELIAAYPHRRGALATATTEALRELRAELINIENPLEVNYLIGHKVAALALLSGPKFGLFLDSDIIAMRAPDALSGRMAAVPASVQHCDLAKWEHIYDSFNLEIPRNAPATLLSEETTAPYYNTGLISVPGDLAKHFTDTWVDCASRIDADPFIPSNAKRPYLDQISFPVAAALCGHEIEVLDEKWNYRGWGWQIPADSDAIFYHYQDMAKLSRQPSSLAAARIAKSLSPAVAIALREQQNF